MDMHALKATDAKFSLSRSTLVNFSPKSGFKLIHGTREPGLSPAVVARGPGKHRGPDWWEGWKLVCWKRSLDNCKNITHRLLLVFCFVFLIYWNVRKHFIKTIVLSAFCETGPFSLQLPHLWCKEASAASLASQQWLSPFPCPCLLWQSLLKVAFGFK